MAHTHTSLQYHTVFGTHQRRPLLTDQFVNLLRRHDIAFDAAHLWD
jgi:REP element-mobilizing transposase RayT